MKLSKMFHRCAYDVGYSTVGHDVNYAFVEEEGALYIYFQGSSSTMDWIRNFLFDKQPYKDMAIPYRVHRGFLAAWKEVEDLVIAKITEKVGDEYRYKKIITVGYSHGGALAAFCHECVWYHRPDIRDQIEGYGFEAPRIYAGWRVKPALRERWERFKIIRDNNDIVTHCPPVIFCYTHVGDIIKVHGDVKLVDGWIPRCVKSHYPQVVYDGLVKAEN